MTAIACIRILIDSDRATAGGDVLAALVGKVAGAFLESRWRWPRRFGEIAPYAFLLADPKATLLDSTELSALSEELQYKLFGVEGAGVVTLAMLEGEQEAVTRFAAVDLAELRRVLASGGVIEGLPGRISEITPQGVRVVSPPDEAGAVQPALSTAPRTRRAPLEQSGYEPCYRAVWCSLKDAFIGSGMTVRRKGARTAFSIVDGPAELPGAAAPEFDIACIEAAPRALVGSHGLMFLPISFDSTVQNATRESYLDVLETLPHQERPRLAAVVYDVPRGPTFAAVAQLKTFLNPYFSFIDLQTADPDFQIDGLTMEAVKSVTFTLPDGDEGNRLAAATRFMAHRDAYQRRRIWPAITNIRTRRELDFCIRLKTPFLSGRAISHALIAPAEPVFCKADRLPLQETDLEAGASLRSSG